MFSTSSSRSVCERLDVPLKAMCSRKCATPLFVSVSYLEPVSIQSPTVAVGAPESSLATLMPLPRTVTSVEGVFSRHSLKLEVAMEDIGLNMLLWATFAKLRALDIFDNDMVALL